VRNPHRLSIIVVAVLLTKASLSCAAAAGITPERHTVPINGFDMYYEVVGEGPPLVLLHAGMQTGRMYDPFVEEWSQRFLLVIPDLRGHGHSTNPSGEFTLVQFAGDVFALLDHLGIERFDAVGASAGAVTLLHMALKQPERIGAMILVGSGLQIPEACRTILEGFAADTYPEQGWNRLREMHHHGDEQIRALFGFVNGLAASPDNVNFTPAQLSAVAVKTLVVHGDRDYCFPPTMAAELYASLPRAYLWVVPNGPHVPISGENTGPFRETVLQFLGGGWEPE
jgi:pimeloyl-ACP methyl ester carboxylesterase